MKTVIKAQQQNTVYSEYVDVSKIYIYSTEAGIYKLCQLGKDQWSWIPLYGTYSSDIELYSSIKDAVERALLLDKNVLEFESFNDFIKYKIEITMIAELRSVLSDYSKIEEEFQNNMKYGDYDSYNSNYKEMAGSGWVQCAQWILKMIGEN